MLDKELSVKDICNSFNTVSRKEMRGNYVCFEILRRPNLQVLEVACRKHKVPYAYYRSSYNWEEQKWRPVYDGVVVRRDHAEMVKKLYRDYAQQQELW